LKAKQSENTGAMSGAFFQRFRWSDAAALAREIDEARAAHAAAQNTGDVRAEVEAACQLGNALTAADCEAEAARLLEAALVSARTLADPVPRAWVTLHLATARQYLGDRALAQDLFEEALNLAVAHCQRELEHYVLHHRGRCYAEQRDPERARAAFEAALKIRLELGEPRAERTRQALAALADF
jgi:tetratricopeptide (TPR) repeat protein